MEAYSDPLALLAADGVSLYLNAELRKLLGERIDGGVGVHYSALLRPSPDPIGQSLTDRHGRTSELNLGVLPGTWQVTVSPRFARQGEFRGVLVAIKDVTALKQQQERLMQTARLTEIGQLAAGIAHEINTPLASITLRAQSLLKKAESTELRAVPGFDKFPGYLETIDKEAFRCKRIIAALLDFARSSDRELRPVFLNALVEQAGELLNHELRRNEITFDKQLDAGLPAIPADEGQLRQVLLALLLNALDATGRAGTIAVETARESDGFIRLTVSDDGAGISPEDRDRVFSPFFTTKPTGSGTGLGLAVCHGVITAHGGTIEIAGRRERGTRVDVRLPLKRGVGEGASS